MVASKVLHIAAYIVFAEIGGMLLWVSLKAWIYAGRDWRRGDTLWTRLHATDAAIYCAIGGGLVFVAVKMLAGAG